MVKSTDNRRNLARNKVSLEIAVIDDATGNQLGKLVNLHQEGLMLISQANVCEDNLYQATLMTQNEQLGNIPLGLDCMWQRDLEQGSGCWAGFRIISISEPALQKIKHLIKAFDSGPDSPAS